MKKEETDLLKVLECLEEGTLNGKGKTKEQIMGETKIPKTTFQKVFNYLNLTKCINKR